MKPFPTILALTALALLGYLLLPRLTVRWQPGAAHTTLQVSYGWPEAGPQALEQQVTAPLEAALALVRDVQEIRSVSSDGSGYIQLELAEGADEDFTRFNVASQVRRLYGSLPHGVSYPTLSYAQSQQETGFDTPVLTYALRGPDDATTLYRYASEQLAPQLSLQQGLARIEVTGGNRLHWRVALQPERIATAGLDVRAIQERLNDHFARDGLGFVRQGEDILYAYREDSPADPANLTSQDWLDIQIGTPTGPTYRLSDLAEVAQLPLPARSYYRINGENSVRLVIYPTPEANQLALAEQVRTRVRALTTTLPTGYELLLEDDATRYLSEELRKTRQRTALSMGILLLFVLLAYRSFRRLGVILFALSVNLGLAFLLYWLLGVELNLYAFAGIAVSFGIMIDNVIIVLDALKRPDGGRVGPAVAGATLTTLASLSVIFFLSAELRVQLLELARVMTINLATSVVVALLLVPALLSNREATAQSTEHTESKWTTRMMKAYTRLLEFLLHYRKTTLLLTILAFGLPLWWLPNRVEGWTWYNDTVGAPYYRDVLRPQLNKWLGGSFRLFSYYVYEGSGYREAEETKLYINAALPDGATLEQLNDVLLLVEGYLAGSADRIDRYTTRILSGQQASIEISFPDGGRSAFPYTLKNQLTAFATNFGGVSWDIYGVGQAFSNDRGGRGKGFQVELRGYNQVGLDRYSDRLAELLLRHPRVQEVDTDANINWWERERAEYLLSFTQEELTRRGLTLSDLRSSLQWFDRNDRPDLYLRGGEPVALTTQSPADYDRWRLENWSVPLDSAALPFTAVARLEKRSSPQSLHKVDQQYLRRVAFDYLGSPQFGERHLAACLDTLLAELPLGFTAEQTTYSYRTQTRELSYLMGLAVVLIFFICALLFESLGQAFNIVLLIPISCIGIFLTLYWFNVRLDQGGYTSFLLVAGLAVNGLILIVNEYNHLVRQGGGVAGAGVYAEAVRRKIVPILLTVVSTSAGLLPFLLGGRNEVFWYALAAGTIGGLCFSVVVIGLISPVFFLRRGGESVH